MLQTQTIEPGTLSVLKKLMGLPGLSQFYLVGGTALSLKFGHRKSIDLDLFSNEGFKNDEIILIIKQAFDNYKLENNVEKFGVFCYIDNVKVDIVRHPHSLIADIENIDGVRMYSTPDIAAMKINAILGRGRKKDFWDLYTLFQHYSLQQIIDFYERKFHEQRLLISIPQAIVYFTDAEESETPVSLQGQTWEKVKKTIEKKVREYLK
jgi:hypothetical protein